MTDPSGIRNDRLGLQAASIALLAALLWGGNAVFIKMGLQGVPPMASAVIRFVLGTAVVLSVVLVTGISLRLRRDQWPGMALLTLIFFSQISLLHIGTDYTTASRSTVMICAHPIFVAVGAHFFVPGDRLNGGRLLGLVLAFAGIVLVFGDALTLQASLYGDALVLASAVLLGMRQVVLKRLVQDLGPYPVLFWQAVPTLPVFALLSLWFERDATYVWSGPVIGALLYQGLVVAGLCFIIWVSLMRRHSASRLGAFSFATPICGVLLSAWLLDEELTGMLLVSVALVAVGITVANRAAADDRGAAG